MLSDVNYQQREIKRRNNLVKRFNKLATERLPYPGDLNRIQELVEELEEKYEEEAN